LQDQGLHRKKQRKGNLRLLAIMMFCGSPAWVFTDKRIHTTVKHRIMQTLWAVLWIEH
jgi:hypothetical protein